MPLRWLQAPVDELVCVDRRPTEIDRETEAAAGKWIADGSVGERLVAPPEVVGLRQRRDALVTDAMAAQLALPTAQAECQQAAQAVMAVSRQRDSALITAAVDGVKGIIEAEMIPAIERVLRIVVRATCHVSLSIGARHRPRREQRGP